MSIINHIGMVKWFTLFVRNMDEADFGGLNQLCRSFMKCSFEGQTAALTMSRIYTTVLRLLYYPPFFHDLAVARYCNAKPAH